MLNLSMRWEHGELGWHNPDTGQHIVRYVDLPDPAESGKFRADTAVARVLELEAELRRRRQPRPPHHLGAAAV